MISKRDFGLYLELRGPGGYARGTQFGLDEAMREATVSAIEGRLPTVGSPAGGIVTLLGPPDCSDLHALVYELGVREDYVYVFRLSQRGAVCAGAGYERRVARSLASELPQRDDMAAFRARLIQLGATESELLALLGEPKERTGWWPHETWMYPGPLTLELRLGVVEG